MNQHPLYDPEDERKLIISAQKGDSTAAGLLLERHRPLLRRLAGRLCAKAALTEELLQAGSVGLLCAIHKYAPSYQTRLITYAVPWILGEMKRVLRSQAWGTEQSTADADTVLDSCESIHLGRLDLRLALEQLMEDERLLIMLRYYRDKTQRETALLLHISQSQVSKLEKRALDHLHEILK